MYGQSSTLFKQAMSDEPLTVLLLVENTQKMFCVWNDLRECYLNQLIDSMAGANTHADSSLSIIESSMDTSTTSYVPPQFALSRSALASVSFDSSLDGRISPSQVNDCIEHLSGTVYADKPHSLCIIIVAASTPSTDCSGLGVSHTDDFSPWHFLAEKLSERRIYCHLAMALGQEDLSPLTVLFEKSLFLQQNIEEIPPFPVDRFRFVIRLSARPSYQLLDDSEHNTSLYPPTQNATALEPSSRRNSHLFDSYSDANTPSSASGTTLTPQKDISIVSHLKLAQGLIKKKQHSKDPQPAPFFADARVQSSSQSYSMMPPPSPPNMVSSSSVSPSSRISGSSSSSAVSASLSSLPLTSRHRKPQSLSMAGYNANVQSESMTGPMNGGRAMSLSRLDRLQRVNQASSGSSPTESLHAQSRRGSSQWIAATGGSGHTGSQGASIASHVQPSSGQRKGARISTPDQDASMSSPGSTVSSLGSGSPSGTVIVTTSDANGRGVGLATGVGDMGGSISNTYGSTSPSFGTVAMSGMVNQDTSPGSVSSYISSDMSSPTTPGSMEDLFAHAKIHALQAHQQGYGVPYQQYMYPLNSSISSGQDSQWVVQHHQRPQQALRLDQSSNQQWPEHQFQVPQFQQAATVPQQHYYPGAYDPTSTYFPPQPASAQQYYVTQQGGYAYNTSDPFAGVQNGDPIAGGEAQLVGSQQVGHGQTMHQPKASYCPFTARGLPICASPPPLIVPSQSHVPLPSMDRVSAGSASASSQPGPLGSQPSTLMPPAQPSQGRTRVSATIGHKSSASTSSITKSNSTLSSSRTAKLKRHKKSTSVSSHSGHVDGKGATSAASNRRDDFFEVSPLYAASTGAMFESMFHIKSSLLEGANPEDVALVAPALGMGGEGAEGSDVMATLPLRAVEAAGGLFQSQLKERGVIVDEAAGTAIVPSVATTGAWLGDNAATSGPLPMTMGVKGSTAMMHPHVVSPTSRSGTTYAGTANRISSTSEYQYDTQDILQEYGASTQWSN